MRNLRRILSAALVLGVMSIAAPKSEAVIITLVDRNSVVHFDSNSQNGVLNWFVDGVDHLFQQWFWYRIGPAGPENSINTISPAMIPFGNPVDTDFDPGPDVLNVRHANALLQVDVRYSLEGGNVGSMTSDIAEQITLTNLTQGTMSLHFFQYTDFDLGGDFPDDTGQMVNANTVQQRDDVMVVSETVVTPAPDRFELNSFPNTLNSLNNGTPTTLNNNAFQAGDVTWAFQWDLILGAGQSALISKDKRIGVPEPASLLLFGMGLIGAAGAARRRKAAMALPQA